MKINIPVEIPDGKTCRFPDKHTCALVNWGLEGPAFCNGFGGHEIIGAEGVFKKHAECLALYEKNFQNPKEPWNHKGAFSIEFFPGTMVSILNEMLAVSQEVLSGILTDDNDVIAFKDEEGEIGQAGRWVETTILRHQVQWFNADNNIKAIRDGEGNLLWKNKVSR